MWPPQVTVWQWRKDGVALYTDVSAIPAADFQNVLVLILVTEDLEAYIPNEDGLYEFVAVDDNGCFAISNAVRVEDLGTVQITAAKHLYYVSSGRSHIDHNGNWYHTLSVQSRRRDYLPKHQYFCEFDCRLLYHHSDG